MTTPSPQTSFERVHWCYIHIFLRQTVPTVDDSLWEELKTGFTVTEILQKFPTVSSGYIVLRLVEKYIPKSTGKAFNQFEKFNEISSVATFLKRPKTKLKLAKSIIIWQASKFRKQTSESMLDTLKQFNVLDIVWIPNRWAIIQMRSNKGLTNGCLFLRSMDCSNKLCMNAFEITGRSRLGTSNIGRRSQRKLSIIVLHGEWK